jgi:hypothetical protein
VVVVAAGILVAMVLTVLVATVVAVVTMLVGIVEMIMLFMSSPRVTRTPHWELTGHLEYRSGRTGSSVSGTGARYLRHVISTDWPGHGKFLELFVHFVLLFIYNEHRYKVNIPRNGRN